MLLALNIILKIYFLIYQRIWIGVPSELYLKKAMDGHYINTYLNDLLYITISL